MEAFFNRFEFDEQKAAWVLVVYMFISTLAIGYGVYRFTYDHVNEASRGCRCMKDVGGKCSCDRTLGRCKCK